ncbi:Molybdenum cofactor biosynthesis protein MoaE [Caenispirillum salinarum AK4]|uniref:Molybdopterin synthase catalytic subunit n=1 Tax=Caenispirillum salinarum AK4 TaxID=1238182 RepID=K9H448_9PROT|nr:molybdenum cofactor biosynthesis protein MoaE [Caenispirillum salinarum]EKV32347.1 Molybdenum cofactor biosynthesis protein MoaE [Caenispirillum salinarum AK4]
MAVRVQREDFDVGAEMAAFCAGDTSVGAVASFVGLVRADKTAEGSGAVSAMTLEHYPGMTERQLEAIEADARERWPLHDVLVVHRYGRMEPGERIVLVLTASSHRQAAFDACAFLMDWLKTKAPFWKLEETPNGGRWVDARESDDAAAARWGGDEG